MNIVASYGCFPGSSESSSSQLQGSKCKSRRKEELLLLRLRGEKRLSVSADPSPLSGAETAALINELHQKLSNRALNTAKTHSSVIPPVLNERPFSPAQNPTQ